MVNDNSREEPLSSTSAARTMLIVDDDLTHVELLRLQLKAAGHRVLSASNGIEARELLKRERIDGIVSDILMPQMDRYSLCLEVRKNRRFGGVPFVLRGSGRIGRRIEHHRARALARSQGSGRRRRNGTAGTAA